VMQDLREGDRGRREALPPEELFGFAPASLPSSRHSLKMRNK
jgi:hypothetical protein